jgi:hypothetical protein
VSGQHHAPAAFTPGKDLVPIVQEAGWAPELVWIGAENLTPPGFDKRNISTIYIYITRLASNEIFSPSNKIHREVRWAKDLSAPRYTYKGADKSLT